MALMDVLLDEMRDLYSAENQLVKALPKMAKGTTDASLKSQIKNHLEETKGQVVRLRDAFAVLGKKATGQHCSGMEGVLEEGQEALEKDEEGANKDLCIVGASLRVEHYEVAGYYTAIALAKGLKQAASEDNATEDDSETKPKSAKEKKSAKQSEQDEAEAAADVSGK